MGRDIFRLQNDTSRKIIMVDMLFIKTQLFEYLVKIAAFEETIDPETNERAFLRKNPAGDKIWYKTYGDVINFRNHYRIDRATGKKEWYKEHRLHRDNDEPAVIFPNGDKEWRQEGRLHRKFGPARTKANGTEEYWYAGRQKPKEEVQDVELVVGKNPDGSYKREEAEVIVDWTGTIMHSADDLSPIWVFDPETLELIRQPTLREAWENPPLMAKLKDIENGIF